MQLTKNSPLIPFQIPAAIRQQTCADATLCIVFAYSTTLHDFRTFEIINLPRRHSAVTMTLCNDFATHIFSLVILFLKVNTPERFDQVFIHEEMKAADLKGNNIKITRGSFTPPRGK